MAGGRPDGGVRTTRTTLTTSDERDRERRAAIRRSIVADRGLLVMGLALLTWLVAYGVALGATEHLGVARTVVQSGLYLVPIAAATLVTTLAVRRSTGRDRTFWTAMAIFSGLWLAGEVVSSVEAVAGALPRGLGTVATGFYLLSYAPALVAALFIGGRPTIRDGLRGLFDTAAVACATAYVGYRYTIGPALAGDRSAHVILDACYPVLNSIVFLVALSAGVGARRLVPLPRLLVTASMLCSILLDAVYSRSVDVLGSDGHWLDLGWGLQACMICLAALTAARHREIQGVARTLPGRWTMLAVYVAAASTLLTVGGQLLTGQDPGDNVAVGAVAVLTLMVRGALANADLRRSAVRLDQARSDQERLAVTDGLTGLYNRRFFEEFLRLEAERSRRHGSPLSLIVADLDHFKWVNDRYGHRAGDEVLADASGRLSSAVRSSDVVARYGGEEFVAVLPEADSTAALEVAERCRRALGDPPVGLTAGALGTRQHIPVTASFGVATLWSIGDVTVEDLVRAADRALYRAKTAGRNRVCPAGEWDFVDPAEENDRTAADAGTPSDDRTARNDEVAETDPVTVALLRAAELIDADQGPDEHGDAIARWSAVMADTLALGGRLRHRCVLAARLHDVGKLAIPQSVLTKPGPLTEQEWTLMRTHPEHSEALVALSAATADLGPVVRAHHERFDGRGYPDGLAGEAIPLESRIIAVCDAWAAMRADRAYAAKQPVSECRRELHEGGGRQFDPHIGATFLALQQAGLVGDLRPTVTAVS